MDIEHIIPPDIISHLPDGFQEGLPLNITYCAAYLYNNYLSLGFLG
ncbi:hypothetical protein ES703_56269 [subsurface metagenome]